MEWINNNAVYIIRMVIYIISSLSVIEAALIIEVPAGNGARAAHRLLLWPFVVTWVSITVMLGSTLIGVSLETTRWLLIPAGIMTICCIYLFKGMLKH